MQTDTTTQPNMQHFAAAIVYHLPGVWDVEPPKVSEDWPREHERTAHIVDGSGRRVSLHYSDYEKRVTVSGNWQRSPRNEWYVDSVKAHYSDPRPSITLSPTRTGEAAAKDIARRFLPEFTRLWDLAQQRKEQAEAYAALTQKNTARLAALAGTEPGGENLDKFSTSSGDGNERGYLYATVNGDSVRMELSSIPLDIAEDVIALITGRHPVARPAGK